MARINNILQYPNDGTIAGTDFLIGSDSATSDSTKTYPLSDLQTFFNAGFVATAHEGYTEAGTRAGGNVSVTLGDYDSSGTGTRLNIDDTTDTIRAYANNFYINDLASGFSERISTDNLTANRIGTLQNSDGTFAWTSDISGLEAIDEGNGIGWRLISRDSLDYGNIGLDAIDFSKGAFSPSATHGATGSAALALGWDTTSSNNESIATGRSTTASGTQSFSTGWLTVASGSFSKAGGQSSVASGSSSFSHGLSTNSSGDYSFSVGQSSIASAQWGFVAGLSCFSRSRGEATFGLYPTDYTPISTTNFEGLDRIFNIGNGVTFGVESDAFQVLKNGTITAPSITNALIDTAGVKSLVSKEWTALQVINEGNGDGYVLANRDATTFGNVGAGAVDFGLNVGTSSTKGATGTLSFNVGEDNTISGFGATGFGSLISSAGSDSFSSGINFIEAGFTNFTTGMGHRVTNMNCTVVGQAANIITQQISDFNATITKELFVVGNGTITNADPTYTVLTRSDAFKVRMNGSIEAPSITNTLIDAVGAKSLVSREWVVANAVTDGDKGDITTTASGLTWTIDNNVVTYAKMQDVSATSKFIGRVSEGAGDPEELSPLDARTILNIVDRDSPQAAVKNDVTTAYTLLLTDINDIITLNNAAAVALTIPTNVSVAFVIGTVITLINKGAGVVTVGGAGVTINQNVGGLTMAQHDKRTITKILTDTWVLGN